MAVVGRIDCSHTTCHTDLPLISLAEKVSGGQLKSSNPTMLIGLHTCGDLASTVYDSLPTLSSPMGCV